MKNCLDASAMVAIGEAMEWQATEGLQHLSSCAQCREQLKLLELTRASLLEYQEIDAPILSDLSAAVHLESARDRTRIGRSGNWVLAGEAALAGITTLVAAISSGVRIDVPLHAMLAMGVGSGLVVARRWCGRDGMTFKQDAGRA